MNEKILQFIWNYKIFSTNNLKDTVGNSIEILDFGKWNQNSGPDFSFAKIKVGNITFFGDVEIHVKASDWALHKHSEDKNYQNIILHVVFEDNIEITELSSKNIPTLELKNYISENTIQKYQSLNSNHQFIPCEDIFDSEKIPFQFSEETLIKKLDEKALNIEKTLQQNKNNYEETLFQLLAYNFGLKINAEIFMELAQGIDFTIVKKISKIKNQLEVLFFGYCGWLNNNKNESLKTWKQEFDFVIHKYQLEKRNFSPKFLRLRPANFPTIRISQFANLYHQKQNVFSDLILFKNVKDVKEILQNIQASEYWNTHYTFDKISEKSYPKKLSEEFINNIIINTILPFKYSYFKNLKEDIIDEIVKNYKDIKPEKNSIINNWENLDLKMQSSLDTQAFLYHFKQFCSQKKCLNCGIALKIFNQK